MSGYLGTPGALAELQYRGGLSTKTDRPASFTRTLGGKRKAMVGARGRREWSVSFDLIGSQDVHGLLAVSQYRGQVAWYPADAAAGNLLSPQASGFDPVPANATDAGLVALPDGTIAATVASTSTVQVGDAHGIVEMVPVRPGQQVTVGAWGNGGVRFQGRWLDVLGSSVGTYISPADSHTGWAWREHTLIPPTGAAFLDMQMFSGSQYARPAVSWGARAVDRPGRGCPKAVVHGLSEALTTIAADDAYGSLDVTITEVG